MKSKLFYIGLNLLAPGIGQFGLKWFFRGTLEFLGAVTAVILAMREVIKPVLTLLSSDNGGGDVPAINLTALVTALGIALLIWIWSMVEIAIFYHPERGKKLPDDGTQTEK
ncbi:MAG: hypothetical protein WC071_09735 [Victivallaceae bacterium]